MSDRITYICQAKNCSKEKTVTLYKYNRVKTHYCSRECKDKNRETTLKAHKKNKKEIVERYNRLFKDFFSTKDDSVE